MNRNENIKIAIDSFLTLKETRGISNYIERLSALIKKNQNKNISFFFIKPNLKKIKLHNKFNLLFFNFYLIIWEQIIFPIKAKIMKCNYVIYPSNTGSYYVSRFLNLKYILVLHDVYFTLNKNEYPQYFNLSQFFSYIYRRVLLKTLCRNAFKIITVSNFAKKMIIKYDINSKHKIIVIKNFIKKFKITNKKKLKKSVLLVTGYHPQKNLQNILPFLLEKLSNFNIFLVGISKKNIRRLVNENLLKKGFKNNNIKIFSHLSEKKLRKVYLKSEIFLMPSIFESFSIPLLEACFYKNIVICSDTGATKETTKNKAIFYSNQNLNDLKKKIENISRKKNNEKKKILVYQSQMLDDNNEKLDNRNFKFLLNSL